MTNQKRINPPDGTGSLILGIILIVVGGGVLIERFTGFRVWEYIWRLWPILLIIMGVKVLLDHNRMKKLAAQEKQS